MRKHLFLALALLVAVVMQAQTYWDGTSNKTFSGTGSQADPFLISTPEQLAGLAARVNENEDFAGKWFKLTSDLWFTDFDHTEKNTWKEWVPIGKMTITQNPHDQYQMTFDTCRFNGNFDGDGHTIHNVYMGSVGEVMLEDPDDPTATAILDFTGTDNSFFGYVKDAVIKNLTIDNLGLAATGNMGGLAAVVHNSTVSNVHITNSYVNQSNTMPYLVGGLIGTASASVIEDCSTDNVSVQACFSGGLIGTLKGQSVLRRSHAIGNVYVMSRNVDSNAQGNGGGLVRTVGEGCLVEDCYASVNLQGGTPAHSLAAGRLGGFCAFNEGTIRNSYATGNIKRGTAGGFCSRNIGIIESCYCTGNMQSGENAGAFVQENGYEDFVTYVGTVDVYPGTIRNCFSTGRSYAVSGSWSDPGKDTTNHNFGFLTSYLSSGYDYGKDGSMAAGCYFNADSVKAYSGSSIRPVSGAHACTKAEMQSQAFVDTLNMVAAIFGLNKWQYNAGAYPTLTGEKATDISAVFAGGDGTKENPFLIDNLQRLKNFRNMVHNGLDFRGMYIKQTADIALNPAQDQWAQQMPEQWLPIGDAFPQPLFSTSFQYKFRGDYDGGFHEVQNMYIHNLNTIQGFFGQLAVDAVVHNLGVTGAYVKCSGSGGIVAGGFPRYDPRITVAQCWTSGSIDGYNVGAVIGPVPCEGTVCLLNCSSSATAHGSSASWAAGPDFYSVCAGSKNDTIGNFLFTGKLNHDDPTSYGSSCTPNSGFSTNLNGFYDIEKAGGTYTESVYADLGRSTAELQTKEQANIFNAYVDKWNATHDFQLNYWEWLEGEYPRINPNFQPPHKVTYDSKGGSAVASERVIDNSFILPPDKPTKEGFIFAGWYSDEAGTQFFDYDLTPITGNLTLYAKWLTPTYGDYDLTPFVNQFATEYHIANKAQLIGFAKTVNGIDGVQEAFNFDGKVIYLDADILLNDTTDWRHWGRYCYAESWEPIGIDGHAFRGRFEGQGHIISGLYYDGDAKYYTYHGLFGSVGASSVTDVAIRQVGVQASTVRSYGNGGLLVGCFRDKGLLEQCFATGNFFYLREVTSDATWHGGLAGILGGEYAGEGGSTVKDCFARVNMYTNRVTHNERAPLLVSGCAFTAYTSSVSTSNCYAAGLATNAGLGSSSSKPADSFWDKDLITDSSYGTAKTSNQLHAKSTFTNWDFENIWGRNESINDGYPYLRCFYEPVADDADAIVVTGINLEETEATLIAGDSIQLHAAVIPAEAVNQKIIWTSSGDAGSKVDENGKVRTFFLESKAGYTSSIQITAKSYEGDFSKTFNLTVVHPSAQMSMLHSRRIGDTEWGKTQGTAVNNFYLVNGWEYMLAAYTKPDSIYKPFQWTSSDETLLAIEPLADDSLVMVGSAEYRCSVVILKCLGEGQVTFKAADERGWSTSRTRTIQSYTLTGVSIASESTEVAIGGTLQLEGVLTPSYTTQAHHITWSSSDESILTVDENGLVTTKAVGSATVTVSVDGTDFAAQKTITVKDLVISGETTVKNCENIQLSVNSALKHTWSSSDEKILTIDADGLVTGVDIGTAEVIYSIPSLNYETRVTISVVQAEVTQIILSATAISISTGGITYQLEATVLPECAADKSLTWTSSRTMYATVSSTGLVTSKNRRGTTTITATAVNGVKATCTVSVVDPIAATGISLNKTAATMKLGETLQLAATLTPADANTQVVWSSSDEDVADVDNKGLVTAYTAGTAVIKATAGSVSASCTITVQSSSTTVYYTIRFLNWDGKVLQSSLVEEGDKPVYTGAKPTRPEDDDYTYTFSGWEPEIVPAEDDADYTAQFDALEKQPETPPVTEDCEDINLTWLQTGGSSLGDIKTDDASVWKYDSKYGAKATKSGGATAYLMTPAKDLSGMKTVTLSFSHTHKFAGTASEELTLWVTPDYKGSFDGSKWQQLTIDPYAANTDWTFVDVTVDVPLNAVGSNTVFAFKYMSTAKNYATWEIKDLKLTAECAEGETPPDYEPITVRLYPVSGYEDRSVYLYAWMNGNEPCGKWPGTKVNKDDAGWWSYTFDKEIRSINIIWTDNTEYQTGDILNVTASTCYAIDLNNAPLYVSVIDCDTPIQESIEEITGTQSGNAPRKILLNGSIYILRDGKTYSVHGQEIK